MSKIKEISVRLELLRCKLQGYDYTVVHIKGSINPIDFMLRHPIIQNSKENLMDNIVTERTEERQTNILTWLHSYVFKKQYKERKW